MKASVWLLAVAPLSAIVAANSVPSLNLTKSGSAYNGLPSCSHFCVEQALKESGCAPDDDSCACQAIVSQPISSCLNLYCSIRDVLVTKNETAKNCDFPLRSRPAKALYFVTVILGSLSLVFIVVRLFEHPPVQRKWIFMTEDWIMVFNAVVIVGFATIGILLNESGFGRDLHTLKFRDINVSQKLLYAHEIVYCVSLTLTRLSILCFYLRVFPFSVVPALKRAIYAALAVTLANGLSTALALALQCIPISFNWDWWQDGAHGHCIQLNALGWSIAGMGIALDLWIMFIPMPEMRKLRLPPRKKISVLFVFVAWGFVMAVNIPRMAWMNEFYESQNPTWHVFYVTLWGAIEVYVSVICACLPRIYMLTSRLYRKRFPSESSHILRHLPDLSLPAHSPDASPAHRLSRLVASRSMSDRGSETEAGERRIGKKPIRGAYLLGKRERRDLVGVG